jgi:hypothetical protein
MLNYLELMELGTAVKLEVFILLSGLKRSAITGIQTDFASALLSANL